MNEEMQKELSHERLDVYRVYLEVACLCGEIISSAPHPMAVLDHLDRALESIGLNFMRANVLTIDSAQRAACLDVSIGSVYECAASLDVCIERRAMRDRAYATGILKLWRIRGMLLGLKRLSANQVREESMPYDNAKFPFVELDMYRVSLESVRWAHGLMDELAPRGRVGRRLDTSTTGTVLNIAEGHGRASVADQNRFMRTAEEHALQTLLSLDLMVARGEVTKSRVVDGKAIQARVISMLHAWCAKNTRRNEPWA